MLGIDDPIIDQDASAGDATTGDAGGDVAVDGTGGDGQADGATNDSPGSDVGPDTGADADGGCPTNTPDSTQIFVDSNATSDAGVCGALATPCKTIQAGLDRAASLGKTLVYVAHGAYIESITLHPAITVQGGWEISGGVWSPSCVNPIGAVTITAPDTNNVTVLADALGGTAATLSTLTINSKVAAAAPGESLYGVFARGTTTTLILNDVEVHVANAGAGTSGTAGIDAGAASGDCLPTSDGGSPPGSGAAGAGGDAGSFASSGYVALGGGAGGAGARGENGVKPGTPACMNCVACSGTVTCSVGNGGTSCGTAGNAGCGGPPGTGGNGGGAGGSSIGLYVFDANVTVTRGGLHAGNGGSGGAGGAAGSGGAGSLGSNGTSGNMCPIACGLSGINCVPTAQGHGDGGVGTQGGHGSIGGAGGGGPGGWSCAYVKASATGAVTVNTGDVSNGSAGSGTGGGANGQAKSNCP